jgi:mono/diheme cytochrome c family protein/cytochrome c553
MVCAAESAKTESAKTESVPAQSMNGRPADSVDAAGEEFFERKIRPLLAQRCFSCHARGQKKGGLGLDTREEMLAGGDSGTAVALGKPEESLLVEAVEYGGGVQMPPDGKLPEEEIAALRQWVALGAPWPAAPAGAAGPRAAGGVSDADRQFWSFQPIGDPMPPTVKQTDWPRKTLDRFVLARLEAEKLRPVGESDRRTFIRRATFDLLGLPPTAEEIDAFVADKRPDAYERLVDRLLASPHYGERQARHWLDLARYGEDQAHTFSARMYPNGYRYRDWVVEAFNRDLPYDRFVVEQLAADLLEEKHAGGSTDAATKMARMPALGFMALGPVYYADAGCAGKAKTDEYDDRIDTLCRSLLGLTVACARCHDHKFDPIPTADYYALAGVFASTQYVEAPLVGADEVKRYDDAQAKVKEAEQRLKDGQALEARRLGESFGARTADYLVAVASYEKRKKTEPGHTIDAAAKSAGLDALVLERWRQRLEADRTGKIPLLAPWRDVAGGATDAERRKGAEAIQATLLAAIEKRQACEAQTSKGKLDSATIDVLKTLVDDRSAPLAIPRDQVDKRMPADRKKHLAELQKGIDDARKAVGPKYAFAHSVGEGPATNLKIHVRGNHKELGDEVPRRFLSVLSGGEAKPFAAGSGRLELARAIASAENPLTARVMVNRIWHQLFGRGIVGTPSNFGLLGERPTHPELLDHLATRFIADGWSVKRLYREIVLSATYRSASTFDAEAYGRDPDNRLLWRMSRRRLDVESWRDAVLAVCGNLDSQLGGPSVNLNDTGNRRRTLYAAVSRHDLNPMLRIFDFPDPNLTSERRVITTVPMQQLFVLNSEFMVQQAKGLAARIAGEKSADGKSLEEPARIERVYRWVLGRTPRADEREMVGRFLATAAEERDAKLTPWEQLAQALLSTNEFTYLD